MPRKWPLRRNSGETISDEARGEITSDQSQTLPPDEAWGKSPQTKLGDPSDEARRKSPQTMLGTPQTKLGEIISDQSRAPSDETRGKSPQTKLGPPQTKLRGPQTTLGSVTLDQARGSLTTSWRVSSRPSSGCSMTKLGGCRDQVRGVPETRLGKNAIIGSQSDLIYGPLPKIWGQSPLIRRH